MPATNAGETANSTGAGGGGLQRPDAVASVPRPRCGGSIVALRASLPVPLIACGPRPDSKIREHKGMFVVRDDCPQFVRTIPVLPRSKKNPDDVEEHAENHIYDAARYALMADRTPHVSFRRRQVR